MSKGFHIRKNDNVKGMQNKLSSDKHETWSVVIERSLVDRGFLALIFRVLQRHVEAIRMVMDG